MCGVFGFATKGGRVDMDVLRAIAEVTMSRGAHAWGMAWIGGDGRLRMYKQTGRITDALGILAIAADARFLIGHCRYATHGLPSDNVNNHPHPADGGWIVHNGMIPDYRRVMNQLGRRPVSHCDSEVLGMLVEDAPGSLMERCVDAVEAVPGCSLVMLGLWKPGRLVAVRRGNPLNLGETDEGYYLASLPDELPGKVSKVKDRAVLEFSKKGEWHAKF